MAADRDFGTLGLGALLSWRETFSRVTLLHDFSRIILSIAGDLLFLTQPEFLPDESHSPPYAWDGYTIDTKDQVVLQSTFAL